MRSRHIRIDPAQLLMRLISDPRLRLEHHGLYMGLLLRSHLPFSEGGTYQRPRIAADEAMLLRSFGELRQVRRVFNDLVEGGLMAPQENGAWVPVDYDPGAWVRRAATPIEYLMVARRDGELCRRCGALDDLAVDHVRPVVAEGPDLMSNFQLLCRPCNSRKGGRV